jgi:hypothetical protein
MAETKDPSEASLASNRVLAEHFPTLRRLWAEGVESGEAAPLDLVSIKRRGRERLAEIRAAAP